MRLCYLYFSAARCWLFFRIKEEVQQWGLEQSTRWIQNRRLFISILVSTTRTLTQPGSFFTDSVFYRFYDLDAICHSMAARLAINSPWACREVNGTSVKKAWHASQNRKYEKLSGTAIPALIKLGCEIKIGLSVLLNPGENIQKKLRASSVSSCVSLTFYFITSAIRKLSRAFSSSSPSSP